MPGESRWYPGRPKNVEQPLDARDLIAREEAQRDLELEHDREKEKTGIESFGPAPNTLGKELDADAKDRIRKRLKGIGY